MLCVTITCVWAGAWKTGVHASGSDLRIPAPPDAAQTLGEMAALRALAALRDSAANRMLFGIHRGAKVR
jgi:hypothetical protein